MKRIAFLALLAASPAQAYELPIDYIEGQRRYADMACDDLNTENRMFWCGVYSALTQVVVNAWICVDPLTGEWKEGEPDERTLSCKP